MRLTLLQELYREHAVAAAHEDGEIIYRNALPPAAWLNHRLETLGLAWRVGEVDGKSCTFIDRHLLPVGGMISTERREIARKSDDGAIIA